jgi:hypothetical protein
VTDSRPATAPSVGEPLRRLLRDAGHALRNAQNAAAVNLEAARSGAAKNPENAVSIQRYLENASRGLEDSVGIAEGIVALCVALLEAVTTGNLRLTDTGPNGQQPVELRMNADEAARLVKSARALAARTGVAVEPCEAGVILTISREHEAN